MPRFLGLYHNFFQGWKIQLTTCWWDTFRFGQNERKNQTQKVWFLNSGTALSWPLNLARTAPNRIDSFKSTQRGLKAMKQAINNSSLGLCIFTDVLYVYIHQWVTHSIVYSRKNHRIRSTNYRRTRTVFLKDYWIFNVSASTGVTK